MNFWVNYYLCLKYIKEQNTGTPDAFKNDNRNICLSQPKPHFVRLPGNCQVGSLLRLKDRPEKRGDRGKGCSGQEPACCPPHLGACEGHGRNKGERPGPETYHCTLLPGASALPSRTF